MINSFTYDSWGGKKQSNFNYYLFRDEIVVNNRVNEWRDPFLNIPIWIPLFLFAFYLQMKLTPPDDRGRWIVCEIGRTLNNMKRKKRYGSMVTDTKDKIMWSSNRRRTSKQRTDTRCDSRLKTRLPSTETELANNQELNRQEKPLASPSNS